MSALDFTASVTKHACLDGDMVHTPREPLTSTEPVPTVNFGSYSFAGFPSHESLKEACIQQELFVFTFVVTEGISADQTFAKKPGSRTFGKELGAQLGKLRVPQLT